MKLRSSLMVVTALVIAGAWLILLPRVGLAKKPANCADILLPGGQCAADVGAALAACCDCNSFSNHGQFVSCMAHATNDLRKAGCLDKAARTSIKRCNARSTCGKTGARSRVAAKDVAASSPTSMPAPQSPEHRERRSAAATPADRRVDRTQSG